MVLIPPKVVLRSLESMLYLMLAMKSSNDYQFASATDAVRGKIMKPSTERRVPERSAGTYATRATMAK